MSTDAEKMSVFIAESHHLSPPGE